MFTADFVFLKIIERRSAECGVLLPGYGFCELFSFRTRIEVELMCGRLRNKNTARDDPAVRIESKGCVEVPNR